MATATAGFYKGSIKIGSGTVTDGGSTATVSSYTGTSGLNDDFTFMANASAAAAGRPGRVVTVHIESGTYAGRSFKTRIMTNDGGGNLVMEDPVPFG